MELINFDTSPEGIKRLMRGELARITHGPHQLEMVGGRKLRQLLEGGGVHHLRLSRKEIEHNMGAGFWDKIRSGAQSAWSASKPFMKPIAHGAIDTASDYILPAAAAAAVTAVAQPELAPVVTLGTYALGHAAKGRFHQAVDGFGILENLGHLANHQVSSIMNKAVIPSTMRENISRAPRSRNIGFNNQSPLALASTQHALNSLESQHLDRVMSKARVMGTGERFSLIGTGGSLLNNYVSPALQSQPDGANFQFRTHLPLAGRGFAKNASGRGDGLYAQARGLYA